MDVMMKEKWEIFEKSGDKCDTVFAPEVFCDWFQGLKIAEN